MITEFIENQQNFLKKELQKDFNEEAIKQNLNFEMDYYNEILILKKKGKRFKWYCIDSWEIRFSKSKNAYCFIEPIEEKVFNEIKPILEAIPERFVVEIIKEIKKDKEESK